eukprot:COSAG02_NODE_45886_length_352_cov_0.842520_1_plen_25_part_01
MPSLDSYVTPTDPIFSPLPFTTATL